ncbi:MAG: FecR domain-containing protein [Crocinitomicaceae bacterium]|nr:FecR domain-containing protein [Crocinitomicaceae bacterium]
MNHSKNQLTSKDKYRKILASWEVPFSKTSEESWNEVSSRLANLPATTKIYRIQKLVWGSAAAAAVIAGFIFFLYHTKNETVGITALNGEIKETILPDGSKSVLNASTTIVYDTDWSEERSVSLEGEAFFEVKKGSTFTVKTKFGSLEVL